MFNNIWIYQITIDISHVERREIYSYIYMADWQLLSTTLQVLYMIYIYGTNKRSLQTK